MSEGLRENRFPHIEFRSFNGERHACVKGGPQVWQLMMVANDFGMDVEKVAFHLDLTRVQVEAGLHYYGVYPDEIDLALEENNLGYDKLKAMLPGLRLAETSVLSAKEANN